MMTLINFLFIALLVTAALLALRFAVHRFFPGWGTTATGLIGGALALAEQFMVNLPQLLTDASGLPWTKILGAETANAVVFGFAAAMVILRNLPGRRAA